MFLFFVLVTATWLCPQSELFKEILVNFFAELLTTILVLYIYIYSVIIIPKILGKIKGTVYGSHHFAFRNLNNA